jgi:protein-disulfide isomerase
MPTIIQKYVDTGKVNFEFRPMAFIAAGSQTADQGAYCAIDQGKFWEYHDVMYNYVWNNAFSKGVDPKTTTILTADIVKSVAHTVGLDPIVFDGCLDKGVYRQKVEQTTTTAQRQGVTGTPYILVNGQAVRGDMTRSTIEAMIKTQL